MDWGLFTGLVVAATGLLALCWTVISFFVRRDFSDLAQLQDCLSKTSPEDALHYAYRAAILERLYRVHFPARRERLALGAGFLWIILLSFVLSAGDTAKWVRDTFPLEQRWIPLLGVMLFLGLVQWMAFSAISGWKENVLGRAEEIRRRYRDLCFDARDKFLRATNEVPIAQDNLGGFSGFLKALDETLGPRPKKKTPTKPAVPRLP